MASRESNPAQAAHHPALQAIQCLAFLVALGSCLVLSLGFAAGALLPAEDSTLVCAQERINPNEASPASLMRLPQIGPARARAIVRHRDRAGMPPGQPKAFQTADDLQQIKGIGPAIVEDVRPWLRFDNPPRDGNQPAQR
jgi:DNA uptake protein ComE-like DNA-binding protein